MPKKIVDDNKIKIFILYLLNKLDREMDFNTLSEIILWDGTINYFYFAECFTKLIASGLVLKSGEESEEVYKITELGREVLKSVEGDILTDVKEKILRSTARLLAYKRSGSSINAEIEKLEEGCLLKCSITDNNYQLLDFKLYLDNVEEANIMKQSFNNRAEIIYRGIIALLTGEARYWS